MNPGFSFGSYVSGTSCVHRLDPRTKLIAGCAFIVVLLCAKTAAALAVCAAFTALCYALAQIPPSKAARSLAPLMAIVVIVAVLNLFVTQGGQVLVDWGILRISEAGVQTCLFMGARLTIMMLGMSLITLTTMTIDLTEAFEWVLKPFARFGVPAHELGMIMGIALRFMPQFANELAVVYHAQVSRGARLSNSPGARRAHAHFAHGALVHQRVPSRRSRFRPPWTHVATTAAKDARTCIRFASPRATGAAAAFMAVLAGCVAAIGYLL